MSLRLLFVGILSYLSFSASAQTNNPIVQPVINLPRDSIVSAQLIASLDSFLTLKGRPNGENNFVWQNELVETFVLLDEMKEVDKNEKLKDNHFYKPYLMDVVKLNDSIYAVKLSYIGMKENAPLFRASFNLVAHRQYNQFLFSSPLKRNTSTWQTKKMGNCLFHYKHALNNAEAVKYKNTVSFFDKKLQAPEQETEIYCCDDFPEVLETMGIDYSLVYNGYNANTNLGSQTARKKVLLNASAGGGFNYFDPHDLWHDRLHRVASTDSINKPVDEGCAFLYGGSWGMSWKEIQEKFNEKFPNNTDSTDWLKLFDEQYNFGDSEMKRLRMNYFLNALIVQDLEKTKGFAPVLQLLTCGKYEKDNGNYFKMLDKLTGINRANFNKAIAGIINKSRR